MIGNENWLILRKNQAELDKAIYSKADFDPTWWNSLENKKRLKLALLVEIGEFANEIKSFTIWKKSKTIDRAKAKEELIDCLGYFLGLVNICKIELEPQKQKNSKSVVFINHLLMNLFKFTEKLFIENIELFPRKKSTYRNWLVIFFEIASWLNMNEKEIMEIYSIKNNINWQRVKKGGH